MIWDDLKYYILTYVFEARASCQNCWVFFISIDMWMRCREKIVYNTKDIVLNYMCVSSQVYFGL